MSEFENNLWAELEREQAPVLLRTLASRRRRRTTRWMGAAAGVAVLAGAAFAVTYFGGTPPAYAVVDNPDGSVTLTVRKAERFDEATAELRERGILVVAAPLRADCPADEARKVEHPALGDTGPVETHYPTGTKAFDAKIFKDRIPVGVTLVFSVQENSDGGFGLITGYSRGQTPKCVFQPAARQPVTSVPQPTPTY